MYEPRWYRNSMGERFRTISYSHLESDIWLAFDIDNKVSDKEILRFLSKKIKNLRNIFEAYFTIHPEFKMSLKPLNALESAPSIISRLAECSQRTKVGPMAGIAGIFSEEIGKALQGEFSFNEIVVENGGDLYLDIQDELSVKLYAGEHPLSNKLSLRINPKYSPLGLCASSGKFGHSLSFGKADLVVIACKDTILADQMATALANMINQASDIQKVLEINQSNKNILHLSIFAFDAFAMAGEILIVDK